MNVTFVCLQLPGADGMEASIVCLCCARLMDTDKFQYYNRAMAESDMLAIAFLLYMVPPLIHIPMPPTAEDDRVGFGWWWSITSAPIHLAMKIIAWRTTQRAQLHSHHIQPLELLTSA
jgi:hypothetical protein